MKKYRVAFCDMFDGWSEVSLGKEYEFTSLRKAKRFCDEKNRELDESNKKCVEHYGVIDLKKGREVYCLLDKRSEQEQEPTGVWFVDLGRNVTCNRCGKRYCTCLERQDMGRSLNAREIL